MDIYVSRRLAASGSFSHSAPLLGALRELHEATLAHGTHRSGSARSPLLLLLGGRTEHIPSVLSLAGQVQRKREGVEQGYGARAFQPIATRREYPCLAWDGTGLLWMPRGEARA